MRIKVTPSNTQKQLDALMEALEKANTIADIKRAVAEARARNV